MTEGTGHRLAGALRTAAIVGALLLAAFSLLVFAPATRDATPGMAERKLLVSR